MNIILAALCVVFCFDAQSSEGEVFINEGPHAGKHTMTNLDSPGVCHSLKVAEEYVIGSQSFDGIMVDSDAEKWPEDWNVEEENSEYRREKEMFSKYPISTEYYSLKKLKDNSEYRKVYFLDSGLLEKPIILAANSVDLYKYMEKFSEQTNLQEKDNLRKSIVEIFDYFIRAIMWNKVFCDDNIIFQNDWKEQLMAAAKILKIEGEVELAEKLLRLLEKSLDENG